MKTTSIVLAATTTMLLSLTSLATQATEPTAASPALTRAEVQAELLRARAAGELPSASDVYGPMLAQAMKQAALDARRPSSQTRTAAVEPAQTASAAR